MKTEPLTILQINSNFRITFLTQHYDLRSNTSTTKRTN